jgi:cyclopropane fatty-acyl-phospholipid synthase-like methyltransferase
VRAKTSMVAAVALLIATRLTAWSQDSIPFVPTPMEIVERMLTLAEVKQTDLLYDLGSGDGRIVITAAKKYGIRGIGVDLDPKLVEQARRKAVEEGVSHLVEFRAGDGLEVDVSDATVVTLYMFKWFNNAMRPKLQRLKPGSRIVAHDFDIDDWKPTKIEYLNPDDSSEYTTPRTLYLWKLEAP